MALWCVDLRWLRFRLRTLLLATVLVALGASYLGRDLDRARIERAVLGEIHAAGGQPIHDTCNAMLGRMILILRSWPGLRRPTR